jgi:hypothetical protein
VTLQFGKGKETREKGKRVKGHFRDHFQWRKEVRKKAKVTEVATRSQAHDENEDRSLIMTRLGSPAK